MVRAFGVSVLVVNAACSRALPEAPAAPVPVSTSAFASPSRSLPSATTSATTVTPALLGAEALRELDEIRRAAATCALNAAAPVCEGAQALARSYPLMHCASDGVDPAYSFAWAASEPIPRATVFTDSDGTKWYVENARSPKLARVDERLWSEDGWISVEPHLRFETDYPTVEEAKRLSALDEQVKKTTMAEGIVRAVFYDNTFVGAFPFYAALTPQKEGGMLYGFGITPKKQPLCRAPEARVLPPDLATFAGEWSRLR